MAKNLKLTAFIFKIIVAYNIQCVNSTSALKYQYLQELEQKKIGDIKVPKVGKNNRVKTMEKIVLYLELVRGVRGVPFAYVVWC